MNFSDDFIEFENTISLTPTDVKFLRKARTTVKNKISKYFTETLGIPAPKFIVQGSFTMGTIIKPISGSFDIDLGVYVNFGSNEVNDWPRPETVSKWLKDSLFHHTNTTPINKKTCVRIKYKPTTKSNDIQYHVDLPIYAVSKNLLGWESIRIGQNGEKGWKEKSDPKGFSEWFNEVSQENENDKDQFKRVVKYLKAWKDQNKKRRKFPNGMLLTVLAGKSYNPNTRDDLAFYKTVRKIYNKLTWSNKVRKPVEPFNDLGNYLTSSQWGKFHESLGHLVDDLKYVLKVEDYSEGINILRNQFGNRF